LRAKGHARAAEVPWSRTAELTAHLYRQLLNGAS
jgi:hypothetical protein